MESNMRESYIGIEFIAAESGGIAPERGCKGSVVYRPTVNRRLIDGRLADWPTGLTKINRQTDSKSPDLLGVDLIDLVLM